ncbi:MAG: hypothetical protein KGZ25_08790 [Planctomycetes bacterium]|nr:hypothetical protein [Planctomycetota bacterium]
MPEDPITVRGNEPQRVDMSRPDGGLPPLPGTHNVQIFRSTRHQDHAADGKGWTYAHHMDLACWKGRIYAVWGMTPKDEDIPPYRIACSTSEDGMRWSDPKDFFPRDVNPWPLRFYFYLAANGRMLAFCTSRSDEGEKKPLLVREIRPDHSFGPVLTLIRPYADQPDVFEKSEDPEFVAACREAVANNVLLEQSDRGKFLDERKMKWHNENLTSKTYDYPFGKAFCFYHRSNEDLVGVCKMGFVTVSRDDGKFWSEPIQPPTLIAGAAKVWCQQTTDGRYAMVYNPDRGRRYPLVLVHGDDGRVFRNMRVVHGELPQTRYEGRYKDIGPQYVRGIAEWSNDGTFADGNALWLIYSMNKEDIWVSRVPLPIEPDAADFPAEDFENVPEGSRFAPGWNIYSPRWSPVSVIADDGAHCLQLRDGDPFDYARAVRCFPGTSNVHCELEVKANQEDGRLEIDLSGSSGARPVRIVFAEDGNLCAGDGESLQELATYTPGDWMTIAIEGDLKMGYYTVSIGESVPTRLSVAEDCQSVERISFRTGRWRGIEPDPINPDPARDVPRKQPNTFLVSRVLVDKARAE